MKKLCKPLLSFLLVVLFSLALHSNETYAAELTDKQICDSVFDASYYAARYPDVAAAVGTDHDALLNHYMTNGLKEARNASATFNATSYKNRYADLSSTYGSHMIKYVRHYVNTGKAEGRDATPGAYDGNPVTPANNPHAAQAAPLAGYTGLGSYVTYFDPAESRATNVMLAAANINNTVVPCGGSFSFSQTVGPRTSANGFVQGTIFVSGREALGIGGGICQVSSTLYACMRTIGLPATERHTHSATVDYVPAEYDATISGNYYDLKFTNIYDKPMLVSATTNDGVLTVSLYTQN